MADNIAKINANELELITNPLRGQSLIMVDRATNEGLQIDYDKLAEVILNHVMSDTMTSDSIQIVVVE